MSREAEHQAGRTAVDFVAVVDQVIVLLRQRGRMTYRTLQRQFQLDDDALHDLTDEILYAHPEVRDDAGRGLVWTGDTETPVSPASSSPLHAPPPAASSPPEAERRQLTVLFCDLVDSTALASQLDPEDLREVVRAYQDTCAKVIARFEGHIAQYLGDGLLVYFGYPLAHEDDAQRAVRAGLGIVEALGQLNARLTQERGVQLAVRLGIHTGLVVVGEVGGSTRQEQLALGETPNLAARLQGLAAPNTLVISATTLQLLGGFFACQPLGTPPLKGQAQPLAVYRVLYESMARSRLEAVGSTGWTPLVGREQESALLLERWAQVKEGVGQVVLLSGEAGIGKSRLVQVLQEQVAAEPQAWLMPCQCSPYHQNTALYPMIDLLERVALNFEREESPPQKLRKLEGFLVQYGLPLAEAVPLLAALLSLPLTADYAPVTMAPERQKQQTLHTLLTIVLHIAAQQPVLFVMEDLHWVDPSTLELLSLLVDQGPTARILALVTFRPDFSPPWTGRAHLTQVTLPRLPRHQATELTGRVAHGKALPAEVVAQVVAKTDGVPLFVEELTKMVLESGLLHEREGRYELTGPLPPLAIPTTLHDSLMARLDRLAAVKSLAQLGATLGREFSYALLRAVAPWTEEIVHQGLHQLVAAEFLYQRGVPPQATYTFKHALIQDVAYQSLLRSTRQQYHQRIAQALEAQFPETVATQPELLAQHYTAAGLGEPAMGYWQRAGQRALQGSAYAEAVAHLTQGLAVLTTLPETPAAPPAGAGPAGGAGPGVAGHQGAAAPEVEHAYTRARALCQQVGDTPQLFPVLRGLMYYYQHRGDLQTAPNSGSSCSAWPRPSRPGAPPARPLCAGERLVLAGRAAAARTHLTQALALYDPQAHRALAVRYGQDLGVGSRGVWPGRSGCWAIRSRPCSTARRHAPWRRRWRTPIAWCWRWSGGHCASVPPRGAAVHAQAAAAMTLATEQGFAEWVAWARSSTAGPWPCRARARRAWPQCVRGSPPTWPRGPRCGAVCPGPAGGGVWGRWTPRRRGCRRSPRRTPWWTPRSCGLRGGAVSPQGGLAAAAAGAGCGAGGSLFPAGPRRRPPPAGEVLGAARRHEPGAPVAAAGQARRSA